MTVIAYLYYVRCELHQRPGRPDIALTSGGLMCEICDAPATGIWRETAEKEDEQ